MGAASRLTYCCVEVGRLFCQGSNDLECLFDAGRPWETAAEAHAVAEIIAVGREDASGGNGDAMLVERAGGERRGIDPSVKLNP